jgi:hypothetical protein
MLEEGAKTDSGHPGVHDRPNHSARRPKSGLERQLAKVTKSAADLNQMQQLRAEATQLASEGRLYDAADKLVDAVNLGRTIQDEQGGAHQIRTREKKVERWTDRHSLLVSSVDPRTVIVNSPCR